MELRVLDNPVSRGGRVISAGLGTLLTYESRVSSWAMLGGPVSPNGAQFRRGPVEWDVGAKIAAEYQA